MARFFTSDYVERVVLRDGTPVRMRLLAPEDRDLLRRGFDRWSAESRYARFLVPKQRLTDDELHYLCDVSIKDLAANRNSNGSNSFMQMLPFLMMMRQRQGPPPVAAAPAEPPPGDGWVKVS